MALIEAAGVTKVFPVEGGLLRRRVGEVRALERVSFSLEAGESLGLVGESGSGKTTLARILAGFLDPDDGRVAFDGYDRDDYGGAEWASRVQMVFQDPTASLNPKLSVRTLLAEPLRQRARWDRRRVPDLDAAIVSLLGEVGLPGDILGYYPHQFSGGQKQRIAIARALGARPRVLLADEPVSALDLSVQAQILNLLADLREKHRLTLVLISHDLTVVRQMTEKILVLDGGRTVEAGETASVLAGPESPVTRRLIEAVPALLR